MMRTTIHVTSKDRHSELALLIQSLRTQTNKDWDIMILDDASGTPVTACHFLMSLLNRIKLEGHCVQLIRNEMSYGVCRARQLLIDKDEFNNPLTCRLDDDDFTTVCILK